MVDPLRKTFHISEHENLWLSQCQKTQRDQEWLNYIVLDISFKYDNMENMKITSSEPKYYLVSPGKGLITSMGLKAIKRSINVKNAQFAVTEVRINDIYRIIMDFKDVPYEGYVMKRFKHMPNDSYLYLSKTYFKSYNEYPKNQFFAWIGKNARYEYAKDE